MMSSSQGSSADPSAPKSSSDSGQPDLDSSIRTSLDSQQTNIGAESRDATPLTTGGVLKPIVEPEAEKSHSETKLPCAQQLIRIKSDDAKGSSVEISLLPANASIDSVLSHQKVEDFPAAAQDRSENIRSDDAFDVKSKTVSTFSSESDETTIIKPITTSTEVSSEQQGDTDTDDDDSLHESDSYCGYEHVSKTILRKSDTIIRSSSRGKSPKKDVVHEDRIELQITASTDSSDVKIHQQSASSNGVEHKPPSDHISPSSQVVSSQEPSKSDLPSQTAISKTSQPQSEKRDTKCKKDEDTSKHKDKKSDSKKSKSKPSPPPVERKPKRKASPSRPLEERITNTVIRRHIKPKPPESVAPKPLSVPATVSDVVSTTDETRGPQEPTDTSQVQANVLESSEKKPRTEHIVQEDSEVRKNVTLVSTPKNGIKPTRTEEILVRETEHDKTSFPKQTTIELKETKTMSPNHGSSTTSSPIIKHVSIKEPPESIPCRDSNITAQGSQKKPFKSALAKDSAGPSQKQATTGEEETDQQCIDNKKHLENGEEINGPVNPKNNKSCCFCWCCCCSCSCLSVNNHKKNQNMKHNKHLSGSMENYFNGEESTPTLEEIRTWGESFDKLMKCSAGRKVFREFLQCEYSEENILFWLACEDLKKETSADVIEEKARIIYEDFISILSPREVSLDSKVRDVINKNMVSPTTSTFDEAQLQIYTLMHRDSYPRFVNSVIFRKLAQLPAPSRKGSMV